MVGGPTAGDPTPTDEDRRQHLGFIQAIITRMSAASSTAKGWLLPVVTASYGFALAQHAPEIGALGMAAVGLFAMLDANYLRQEQAYRRLYDTVANGRRPVPPFTLDPSEADDPIPQQGTRSSTASGVIGRWVPDRRVWLSWSIAPFYGGLLVGGAVVVVVA